MNKPVILCVGGDSRYIYVCKGLCEYGKVYSYGINGCSGDTTLLRSLDDMTHKADVLVLPMLSSTDLDIAFSDGNKISCLDLSEHLNKNSLVVGGRLNTQVIEFFSSLGHDVKDYYAREELVIKNCVPTAEGALQIAMQELAVTVCGTKTLVLGFGRVAKASAKVFSALGSEVTVCARKLSQLAQAENEGYAGFNLKLLEKVADRYDIVINTVPALILTENILKRMRKDSIVIDLASKPGGTDFAAAKLLNIKAIHALALPGKVAPITSGELIAEAIRNIYSERRETDVFTRH